jgi:hypothetical protein
LRLTIILLATVAATTSLALLARSPSPAPARAPVALAPVVPAQSQPPERSVVGTLDAIDVKTMQIVVGSASGKQTLHVQSGATIRQGSKTIKPAELPAHKGERVKVRYRESGGVRQAEWIVLASPPPHQPKRTPDPKTAVNG